jgi:two-component system response regulator HydG
MDKKQIFIVDDDSSLLQMLERSLGRGAYAVRGESSGEKALEILQQDIFDVVITDLMLGSVTGIDILKKAKAAASRTEVIVITGHGSVDSAVQAMKQGAFEYITKPIDLEEMHLVVQKACERQRLMAEVKNLRSQIKDYYSPDNIIAAGPAMQKVLDMVKRIAVTNSTVLIEGASGSGKEVVARAIHYYGTRSEGAFVAVNCAALPETLLESELFGYVKGAFTGAHASKKGLFEEANGGTIFLDEIGETSPAFQVKLLRVLQEGEIRRVGDIKDISVDVRVLASSNTPVRRLVEEGKFRQDLYFRLRVIPLYVPQLAQRREDIVPLAQFFVQRYCRRTGRPPVKIAKDAARGLEAYAWPGNVRELENTIERAMILLDGDELREDALELDAGTEQQTGYVFSDRSLAEMERLHIDYMLKACGWNQKEAARRLGIGYNTLWRKIKLYQLHRDSAQDTADGSAADR